MKLVLLTSEDDQDAVGLVPLLEHVVDCTHDVPAQPG